MKKIITSNGKFEITNSLYESIKKNNPELLKEWNSWESIPNFNPNGRDYAQDIFVISKIFKDITGKEYNDNYKDYLLSLFKNSNYDTKEFQKLLQNDINKQNYQKSNQNNNQSVEQNNNQSVEQDDNQSLQMLMDKYHNEIKEKVKNNELKDEQKNMDDNEKLSFADKLYNKFAEENNSKIARVKDNNNLSDEERKDIEKAYNNFIKKYFNDNGEESTDEESTEEKLDKLLDHINSVLSEYDIDEIDEIDENDKNKNPLTIFKLYCQAKFFDLFPEGTYDETIIKKYKDIYTKRWCNNYEKNDDENDESLIQELNDNIEKVDNEYKKIKKILKLIKNNEINISFEELLKTFSQKGVESLENIISKEDLEKIQSNVSELDNILNKYKNEISKRINDTVGIKEKEKSIASAMNYFEDDIVEKIRKEKREDDLTDEEKNHLQKTYNEILDSIYEKYGSIEDDVTFFNYKNKNGLMTEDLFKKIIKDMYLKTFYGNEEYAKTAINRVLSSLDDTYRGEKDFFSDKEEIKTIFDKVVTEINNFKENFKQMEKNNQLVEGEIKKISKKDLFSALASGGMEKVDELIKNPKKISQYKNRVKTKDFSGKDVNSIVDDNNNADTANLNKIDDKNPDLSESDKELIVRKFLENYVSNDTISFIKNLYDNYCKNINDNDLVIQPRDDFQTKKAKVIAKLWKEITNDNHSSNTNNTNNNTNNDTNDTKKKKRKIQFEGKNYNKNHALNEDNDPKIEWSDDEKNIAEKEISDNAKILRMLILGIDKKTYEQLKNYDKLDNTQKNEIKSKIDNEDNLLNYLGKNELKTLMDTLTIPLAGETAEEKLNNGYKRFGEIVQMIDICTFDTEIPPIISKAFNDIRKNVSYRTIVGATCHFHDFGKLPVIPGFLVDRPREMYINSLRNEGIIFQGIPVYKPYEGIPKKEFWKNVAYISCWSRESFGLITAAISDISSRNELNIQQRMISTGLQSDTIIYTLIPQNDSVFNKNGFINSRNGNVLYKIQDAKESNEEGIMNKAKGFIKNNISKITNKNDKPNNQELSMNEEKILSHIKRRYFIIVSEGIFRKGQLLSKIGNKMKGMVSNNNQNLDKLISA